MLCLMLNSVHVYFNISFVLYSYKDVHYFTQQQTIRDSKWNTAIHLITLTIHMTSLINCCSLFTDYRGRMDIWFKTLLLFVVFNKVHLYRQLMNSTCLELAKPSNKHLRLSCNDSSIYHCLLNGNSTDEFEICKNWKWIPGGKLQPLVIS